MRYVLNLFEYPNRDPEVVEVPDPLIVRPASKVYEHGETPALSGAAPVLSTPWTSRAP